ncbi:hypothetical protein BDW62DRAFT_216074 [Aspergillus aurantiobrunneus]
MPPVEGRRAKQHRPPRKKACKSCTRSKVRCGLERPTCSRCIALGRVCEYTTPNSVSRVSDALQGQDAEGSLDTAILESPFLDSSLTSSSFTLDLANTDLVPNESADNIRDRWLRPYLFPLGREEVPKLYQPFTLQFISRVLSTYPYRMLRDGDVPPIIHHAQVSSGTISPSLANCYTLVRMRVQAAPGSEAMVVDTVQTEMDRLAAEPSSLPDIDHLSAFQAYLIYALLMYVSPPTDLVLITDRTMITLMEMAFRTARHGLISASELSRTKPTWESWIVASAKRRAIYVMYLFSSLYNAEHSLPNFLSDELRGVFVPEGKSLWEAGDRVYWDREYDMHLREWEDGMLEISELWRSEETGSSRRRSRIERWVRTVDEFGMMLFSVCVHLHGC